MLATLFLLVGLPHGGLDIYLLRQFGLSKSYWSALFFILGYILLAIIAFGLWVMSPILGLVVFMIIACYHFSTDWGVHKNYVSGLMLSSLLLATPAMLNFHNVIIIFHKLYLSLPEAHLVASIMKGVFYFDTIFFVISIILLRSIETKYLLEMLILLCFGFLFGLYAYFIVYFCLLHSSHHFYKTSLKLNKNIYKTWLLSVPFVMPILLLALFMFYVTPLVTMSDYAIRWLFIGLFSLTVPHMLLIDIFLKES